MQHLEYKEFKKEYSKKYYLCEKLGYYYNDENRTISYIPCNNWECKICRPGKQKALYFEILKNMDLK